MSDVRGTGQRGATATGQGEGQDLHVEREQVALHNEAETNRRDRIRWGPVWAGIVTALGTFLFLQLALVATGIVDLTDDITDHAVASGIAALLAFFLGGVTTGGTAMWQGVDDGILHGIVMWFVALVALLVLSTAGAGLALGAFNVDEAFQNLTNEEVDTQEASDDARDAAGTALAALTLGLIASAAGGAVGTKLWPKDDVVVDVARVRRGRS